MSVCEIRECRPRIAQEHTSQGQPLIAACRLRGDDVERGEADSRRRKRGMTQRNRNRRERRFPMLALARLSEAQPARWLRPAFRPLPAPSLTTEP
jgi:hypothetical protein